jgi:hypothetical protein
MPLFTFTTPTVEAEKTALAASTARGFGGGGTYF